LDNYILQPFIFSKSVLAHPLEIFVVILSGANFAGITGMVLAIPIYTILRSFAKIFFEKFKIVRLITKNMNESGF
jgi:predicted PurR-regulated permease PerM